MSNIAMLEEQIEKIRCRHCGNGRGKCGGLGSEGGARGRDKQSEGVEMRERERERIEQMKKIR